jgi:hypothetical protein
MDVLEYWEPELDWERFAQGELGSNFWHLFTQFVRLCHAFTHWGEVAKTVSRERSPASLYPESRYTRSKRKAEREAKVKGFEGHKYRAAYLAAEKLSEMGRLLDSVRGPEERLYCALRIAIEAPLSRHERGHFGAAAFNSFDAKSELVGKPEEIARRWRSAVNDPLTLS